LPYDSNGNLSKTNKYSLILREGAKIKIMKGSYSGCKGKVGMKNEQGNYNLQILSPIDLGGGEVAMIDNHHLLGYWFLFEAQQGLLPSLPVINDD
jgi:hypothetical protein